MRKNSVKNIRINGEVQKELSSLIQRECKDPRIHPMTSVVAAEVAPDLKTAKIYISVLGVEEDLKVTLQGLKAAKPFLRTQLAKNLNLRNTPELFFVGDLSIAHGVSMAKLIEDVNAGGSEHEEETDELPEEEE